MGRRNKTVTGANRGQDEFATQMDVQNVCRLVSNSMYQGVVLSTDVVARTMDVQVGREVVSNCLFAAGALAAPLGFAQVALPAVGAEVLVLYTTSSSYVFGGAPTKTANPKIHSGTVTGYTDDDFSNAVNSKAFKGATNTKGRSIAPGFASPRDLYPGEYALDNDMGVYLRLLHSFAQLSAGDLAKIEVHLHNDMVRIVSNYFVHHNVGGDEMIWSNGRCNWEKHFTSYPHEAEGKETKNDELAPSKGTGIADLSDIDSNQTGRWRLSTYMGFLGDMIHTFVTDPTPALTSFDKEAERAGKFRAWVGADGTCMVQTVAGVHVEVAPVVVVPTMHSVWNDPELDAEEAIKNLDDSFLKLWGSGPNWDDLKYSCWQMRNYARYITLYHSLARFKQMEANDLCSIPTEDEAATPEPTCLEEDKEQSNPAGTEPYEQSAIFSMDPSGSITVIANGNTSVILNDGNIQVNAPGNIELQAGGTISLVGRNVSVKALHHIELVAIAGSLCAKARTAFKALCERGMMWLKSDSDPENDADDVESAYPLSDPPSDMPEAESSEDGYGIFIDAAQSSTRIHSAKKIEIATSKPAEDDDSSIDVTAKGTINIASGESVRIHAVKKIRLFAREFLTKCSYVGIKSLAAKLCDVVLINQKGITTKRQVVAQFVQSVQGYLGKIKFVAEYNDAPDTDVTEDTVDESLGEMTPIGSELLKSVTTYTSQDLPTWEFSNDWSACVGSDISSWFSLKASPLHDMLAVDTEAKEEFDECRLSKCDTLSSPRTDTKTKQPWPGKNAKYFIFSNKTTKALGTKWETQFSSSDICSMSDMTSEDVKYYFKKQQ